MFGPSEISVFPHNRFWITNFQILGVEKVPMDHMDHFDFQVKSDFEQYMSIKNQLLFGKSVFLIFITKMNLLSGGKFSRRSLVDFEQVPCKGYFVDFEKVP